MTDTELVTSTRHVAAMTIYAADLVRAYPDAPAQAISDKLLTVWPGSDQLVRRSVAVLAVMAAASQVAA